ncbi:MAG: hypothetical protein KGO53_03845 [Alphaproteobacteria bacterium]|nr:hypothetical protein [Alphaproteobacteria bacterium]
MKTIALALIFANLAVGSSFAFNPQPDPPGRAKLNTLFLPGGPVMINPQPLPPGAMLMINPQPLPPGGRLMLNPQPLPPG